MRGFLFFLTAFLLLALSFPGGASCAVVSEDMDSGRRGGVVLALSGGGIKGFAHIGVLKILEEKKIPIAGIVGTSMGAIMGGLYASGYNADQLFHLINETDVMGLLSDTNARENNGSDRHSPPTERTAPLFVLLDKKLRATGPKGLLQAASLMNFLAEHTAHIETTDFRDMPIPFACVASDLGTGEPVVLKEGNLASAMRASSAIPGLLEPWPVNGRLLVDGGLVDNMPVDVAKELFPGHPVIAVNLTPPVLNRPQSSFTSPVDVMLQAIDIMTIDNIRKNNEMADLVLYPDVDSFSMLNPSGYEEIYRRGLRAAEENIDSIMSVAAEAGELPERRGTAEIRVVRSVSVDGAGDTLARDIERDYRSWIGGIYNADSVADAIRNITGRNDVAAVNVDVWPSDEQGGVDVRFRVEKKPPFEITADGYTSNLNYHRWLEGSLNAVDMITDGDSGSLAARYGNEEWGLSAKYFTPLLNDGQWGFSLSAQNQREEPEGFGIYSMNRYSARALYYKEAGRGRIGFGAAAEYIDAPDMSGTKYGPYLYYNIDTLDSQPTPTKGVNFTSQIWWNSESVWTSRSHLAAYIPLTERAHVMAEIGLETGDKDYSAYRALLGAHDELFSLAPRPLAGDQAFWIRAGVGFNLFKSWWGALRSEFFAGYGMIMNDWSRENDAWETGVALSVPGQFLNGKIMLIYNNHGELMVGYTIGNPKWNNYVMP